MNNFKKKNKIKITVYYNEITYDYTVMPNSFIKDWYMHYYNTHYQIF